MSPRRSIRNHARSPRPLRRVTMRYGEDPDEMVGTTADAPAPQPETVDDRLLRAADRGTYEDVQSALAAGADPNVRDRLGIPALVMAARRATQTGACRLLLAAGATVDAGVLGLSPLCLAAAHQDLETAHLLLAAGADVNDPRDAWPALSLAIDEDGHTEMVTLLARAGAHLGGYEFRWHRGHYQACAAICRLVTEGAVSPGCITALFSSDDRRVREMALCALAVAPTSGATTSGARTRGRSL